MNKSKPMFERLDLIYMYYGIDERWKLGPVDIDL